MNLFENVPEKKARVVVVVVVVNMVLAKTFARLYSQTKRCPKIKPSEILKRPENFKHPKCLQCSI